MPKTNFRDDRYDYNFNTKQKRFVSKDGDIGEWEQAEGYLWSKQELRDFLESNYPKYIGLPLFNKLIESWGERPNGDPIYILDLSLNMLRIIPALEKEYLEIKQPDIMKALAELNERVTLLEETNAK